MFASPRSSRCTARGWAPTLATISFGVRTPSWIASGILRRTAAAMDRMVHMPVSICFSTCSGGAPAASAVVVIELSSDCGDEMGST